MTSVIETPHLNPLPKSGGRRIAHHVARLIQNSTIPSAAAIRLALSQRERIKVRDYFLRVSQSRPKSQLEHCPILHESGDSRIGRSEFRGSQRTDLLCDRAVDRPDNCVRHHRLRRRVSRRGNRNPECRSQEGAADEICNPRNFDCASAAKERVPIWSGACAGNEHDSQNYLTISRFFEKAYPLLTSILSPQSGRGGKDARPTRSRATTRDSLFRSLLFKFLRIGKSVRLCQSRLLLGEWAWWFASSFLKGT